jgi:hypothetical protein
MDSLSLCPLHSSYDQLCIVDQTVKIYIGFVAGEAAPYPPPSDPLLATPDPSRILLPRQRSTGLGKSSSLASDHYLRFGFGPIIRLQLRLEPLFLPHSTRMAAVQTERLCLGHRCPIVAGEGGTLGAAPFKVNGPAADPRPRPSPRARPFLPNVCRRKNSGCVAPLLPVRHCSPRSSAGNAPAGRMPSHAPVRRLSPRAAP